MSDRSTTSLGNAELLRRVQMVQQAGSCLKAAVYPGLGHRALEESMKMAVARGLVAAEDIPRPRSPITEGQIIERLNEIREAGSIRKACDKFGHGMAFYQGAIRRAKERGISVEGIQTILRTEYGRPVVAEDGKLQYSDGDKLKAQLQLLNRENAALRKVSLDTEQVREAIYGLSKLPIQPPTWPVAQMPASLPGVPMTIWSDWHWGETIERSQVAGSNEFNREIAEQRVQRLVEVTTGLALEHMVRPKYPGIVIALGGDMISGDIHEELRDTNWGTVQQQFIEVQEALEWSLDKMASSFGKVFVPCVVGNHGRDTLKPRMKNRVFTSHEWNLYCQLERTFKKDKRFNFYVPSEADAFFTVQGHRFLLNHGDTLGVRGGDGIIGAIGPIARGTFKVGRSEAQVGRSFDTLLMGHWHTYQPRGDMVPVIVNGSLKGYDEYARLQLRVPYSRPSQALWFVHAKHGITAQWQVYLDKAPVAVADQEGWVSWKG